MPQTATPNEVRVVPSEPAHPRAILVIILVSYFLILLDNSVVFTGLPSIRAGLDLSQTELSWVQDAYTLVFGGLLLLGARLGEPADQPGPAHHGPSPDPQPQRRPRLHERKKADGKARWKPCDASSAGSPAPSSSRCSRRDEAGGDEPGRANGKRL